MSMTAEIATDLLTPLGAYLRLREGAPRRVPARVGRARPARPPLVRRPRLAARRLRRGGVARRAGRRLPRLRRRRAARADRAAAGRRARASRRAASSCRSCSSASTTRAASPRCSSATPTRPRALLDGPQPDAPRGTGARGELRRFPERDEHLRRVERAKEHIREGDVFQVVIAQRAERPTSASAFELYRALRRVNPSPYLFLLELGDLALVGSSPETRRQVRGPRAPRSTRSPARSRRARATPRRCSPRRRTAPST